MVELGELDDLKSALVHEEGEHDDEDSDHDHEPDGRVSQDDAVGALEGVGAASHLRQPQVKWHHADGEDGPTGQVSAPVASVDHNLEVVRDDNAHRHKHTVGVESEGLSVGTSDGVHIANCPHSPDKHTADDRVNVHQDDELEEATSVDEGASVGVEIGHTEGKVLLLLDGAVVLEADLLIVHTVEENEPIGHQDVEASDEQVVNRLDA